MLSAVYGYARNTLSDCDLTIAPFMLLTMFFGNDEADLCAQFMIEFMIKRLDAKIAQLVETEKFDNFVTDRQNYTTRFL